MKIKTVIHIPALVFLWISVSAITTPDKSLNKKQYLEKLAPGKSLMVYVPKGEYFVGDRRTRDSKPARLKEFRGFYIDIHPVTNTQYLLFLEQSSYKPEGNYDKISARSHPDYPAVNLTFNDAASYARFYNKRLPTEWEWEVAARSLKKDFSQDLKNLLQKKKGNFFSLHKKEIKPVLNFPKNKLGLFDTLGNIFEWTSSDYPADKILPAKSFKPPLLKVLKGGAWTNIQVDISFSTRTPFPHSRTLNWLGFRCARSRGKIK